MNSNYRQHGCVARARGGGDGRKEGGKRGAITPKCGPCDQKDSLPQIMRPWTKQGVFTTPDDPTITPLGTALTGLSDLHAY